MSTELDWIDGSLNASPTMTAAGLARRDAMLEILQAVVVGRRRRRRAARWAAAALVIVAAVLVWPDAGANAPDENPGGLRHIAFEEVRNDPDVVARHGIDDDELLDLCREVGRPTGLIRIRDRVILTAEVAGGDL